MKIKSLTGVGFDTVFEAFRQAFADYEVQNDREQLRTMLSRRGFAPALSFAAFDGGRIAAFTFNGIGEYDGIPTAYDTGTGTLKEYRGQGLVAKVFEYSIPRLQDAGVRQYLLEVLQHNTPAVSVYRKLGFKVTREFNYFIQDNGKVVNTVKTTSVFEVRTVDMGQLATVSEFWDFIPSWQNSFESILRLAGDFTAMGVFKEGIMIGYCVFEPGSGDITQLAVAREHRRRGAASLLLQEMLWLNRYGSVKAINTDVVCDSVTGFMKAKNIELRGKQFEMIKPL